MFGFCRIFSHFSHVGKHLVCFKFDQRRVLFFDRCQVSRYEWKKATIAAVQFASERLATLLSICERTCSRTRIATHSQVGSQRSASIRCAWRRLGALANCNAHRTRCRTDRRLLGSRCKSDLV